MFRQKVSAELFQAGLVLIPLSSGLVFRLNHSEGCAPAERLNPFIFRAGVQAKNRFEARVIRRLNPFIFRAGVQAPKEVEGMKTITES